uniref:Uncharacterized protein n=1 Tax=Oryza meridionalis TaxID=40149 RepID=A0A0E0DWF2_9ORYZ
MIPSRYQISDDSIHVSSDTCKYHVILISWASCWWRSTPTRTVGPLQPSLVDEDGDGGGRGWARRQRQ